MTLLLVIEFVSMEINFLVLDLQFRTSVYRYDNIHFDQLHFILPAFFSPQVTSPYGNNLHHNENVTQGQFAFTATESGNYMACFWIDGKHQEAAGGTILSLEWKTGISAKDWDSVAKKEKLEVLIKFRSFSFKANVIICDLVNVWIYGGKSWWTATKSKGSCLCTPWFWLTGFPHRV